MQLGLILGTGLVAALYYIARWDAIGGVDRKAADRRRIARRHRRGLTKSERANLEPARADFIRVLRSARRECDLLSPSIIELFAFEQANHGYLRGSKIEDGKLYKRVQKANAHLQQLRDVWERLDGSGHTQVRRVLTPDWQPPGALQWSRTGPSDPYASRLDEIRALGKAVQSLLSDLGRVEACLLKPTGVYRG